MTTFRVVLLMLAAVLWYMPEGSVPTPAPDIEPISSVASVLIVEETSDRKDLSEGQIEILRGVPFRKWLDEHKVAYRIWDQDMDASHEKESGWEKALKSPRKSLPWIYVSNGSKGYSGPLPETVEETESLIGKYL